MYGAINHMIKLKATTGIINIMRLTPRRVRITAKANVESAIIIASVPIAEALNFQILIQLNLLTSPQLHGNL
jgi:hypothetical protein